MANVSIHHNHGTLMSDPLSVLGKVVAIVFSCG
jgi:hypothetical protein